MSEILAEYEPEADAFKEENYRQHLDNYNMMPLVERVDVGQKLTELITDPNTTNKIKRRIAKLKLENGTGFVFGFHSITPEKC